MPSISSPSPTTNQVAIPINAHPPSLPDSIPKQLNTVFGKAVCSFTAGIITYSLGGSFSRADREGAANVFVFKNLPHDQRVEYFDHRKNITTTIDLDLTRFAVYPALLFCASGGLTDLYNLGKSLTKSIYDRTCSHFWPSRTDNISQQFLI